jgi:hypothetical protein
MTAPEFTDEDLMAYADGELAEDRAASLDMALAGDADLAERFSLFVETRMISADALRPMLAEPVPAHLVQRVRDLAAAAEATHAVPMADATVVAFPASAQNRPLWQLPIAASLALAVGLGAGFALRGPEAPGTLLEIAAVTDPAIAQALFTLASGESASLAGGARFEAITTYLADDYALCREFEYDPTSGTTFVSIACHDGQKWQVRLSIAAAATDETGYAPASSLEALDAYLTATNASAPMTPADETTALSNLP